MLVVDNTFASPYLQQPLALGADVVVHSTTKYMGGHSDVVGGALVIADDELGEELAYHQNAMGAVAGPFDSWLVLRGIKTLAVRMDRHCANAERVVEMLTAHPKVTEVLYPGLPEHPGHEIAAKQMSDFGGMVSFQVAGGEDDGRRGLRPRRALHPRRVPRRRRVADRAPGPDDARVGGRLAAGGAGRPGPPLGRHRERRRPARGPHPRARLTCRPGARAGRGQVICVDVGSTYTKAALVDLAGGGLLATASRPTSLATDVMDGVDACRAELGAGPDVGTLACSSAGGGLRLAVVGYERVVTAEAGHRVGLSAGARVVHVAAGPMDDVALAGLLDSRPDVVLLVGGTDGGNSEILRHNAGVLAAPRLTVPVVVAGNLDARDDVTAVLTAAGVPVTATANVLPVIGRLDALPARLAIREVFIRHVIGGKGLSRRADFPAMVRAATPDAVLAGVEVLADGAGGVEGVGDVLVVDVGGATTDVYSVVTPQGEDAVLRKEVVEVMWRSRTVEGDLGVRWNAGGVVDAAVAERLVDPAEEPRLRAAAKERVGRPGVPAGRRRRPGRRRPPGAARGDRRAATACPWWQGPARGGAGRRLRRGPPARDADTRAVHPWAGHQRPRRRVGGARARSERRGFALCARGGGAAGAGPPGGRRSAGDGRPPGLTCATARDSCRRWPRPGPALHAPASSG